MSHVHFRLALILAVIAVGSLSAAQAQYRWQDAQGRVIYSDRPPPPEIPEKSIRRIGALSEPGPADGLTPGAAAPSARPAETRSPQKPANAGTPGAATGSVNASDAARQKADLERYCAALREQIGLLAGGGRLMVLNARGEREYLDDEGIAKRTRQAQAELTERCERR